MSKPTRRAPSDAALLALCRQWSAAHDRHEKTHKTVEDLNAIADARIPPSIRRGAAATVAAGYPEHLPGLAIPTFAESRDWRAKDISPSNFISPREISHRIAELKEAGCEHNAKRLEDTRNPDGSGALVVGAYFRRVRPITAAERRAIAREERRYEAAVRFVERARATPNLAAAYTARGRALEAEGKLLDKVARARARTPAGVLAKIAVLRKFAPHMARDGLSEYEEGLLADTILRDAAKMLAQPWRAAA
jgi:GrpB-like predicted nucleotidyltransferase (UPF0157 family)